MSKKRIRYLFEALAAYSCYGFFRVLPLDIASNLGGWLGRTLGPKLGITRLAYRHLQIALPEQAEQHPHYVQQMWDNLGRVIAEYAHLDDIAAKKRIEFIGLEHITPLLQQGKTLILFSGHLGNWETTLLAANMLGFNFAGAYRTPNNPLVARLLEKIRQRSKITLVPKGREGSFKLIQHLRQGGHAGLLIDQKMNDGITVPFFGRNAKTADGVAVLAEMFKASIIPVRAERLQGAHFRITAYAPLVIPDIADKRQRREATLLLVHEHLEAWIRDKPAQWLWLHRRWPNEG